MFPNYLDGAKVLEYTNKGHYGFITDYDENDIPFEREICFLAVCYYEAAESCYYLFSCDDHYNVVMDSCLYTVEQCKRCKDLPAETVWFKK